MTKNFKYLQKISNLAVKIFLFPLIIVGLILRVYDKFFNKKALKRKRINYNIWN